MIDFRIQTLSIDFKRVMRYGIKNMYLLYRSLTRFFIQNLCYLFV